MSKSYRDKKKRSGVQNAHKGRFRHLRDNDVPLNELIEEIRRL